MVVITQKSRVTPRAADAAEEAEQMGAVRGLQ